MTRTALRHILSALAAAMLVSASAASPASAQHIIRSAFDIASGSAIGSRPASAQTQIDPPSLQLNAGVADTASSKRKRAKGLVTRRDSQRSNPPITLEISCGNTF